MSIESIIISILVILVQGKLNEMGVILLLRYYSIVIWHYNKSFFFVLFIFKFSIYYVCTS